MIVTLRYGEANRTPNAELQPMPACLGSSHPKPTEAMPALPLALLGQAKAEEEARMNEVAEEMRQALGAWVFCWHIFVNTKNGKLDYAKLQPVFQVGASESMAEMQCALSPEDRVIGAFNVVKPMTGTCAIVFDSAMDRTFGKNCKNTAASGDDLTAAQVIVFQIRNAYAHGPVRPHWHVTNPCHRQVFEVNRIGLRVDLDKLNGQRLMLDDLGGVGGLVSLFNYCIESVKGED